jgi:hypothetical protein
MKTQDSIETLNAELNKAQWFTDCDAVDADSIVTLSDNDIVEVA